MTHATDKKFNDFLKKQRVELEPSAESINRIRSIATEKVKTVEQSSFNWNYALLAIASVLIALFIFNPFETKNSGLLAVNQDLNQELIQLNESIEDIYESLDSELMVLDESTISDNISTISTDINQILDEF